MKLLINGYFSNLGQTPKRLAFVALAFFSGLMLSKPALAANITVASPINGTSVASPIWVRAHNVGCDGLTPTAFGFSIDNSGALTKGVTAHDVDVINVGMAAGTHTIHFKSWTANGACPVVSTTFKVAGSSSASTFFIAVKLSRAAAPRLVYSIARIPALYKIRAISRLTVRLLQ